MRWPKLWPARTSGAERRLPAGAATAHLPRSAGTIQGRGAQDLARPLAKGTCRRCAVERARSARALSPIPPPLHAIPRVPVPFANLPPMAKHAAPVRWGVAEKRWRSETGGTAGSAAA
jgi:hypothetical protein